MNRRLLLLMTSLLLLSLLFSGCKTATEEPVDVPDPAKPTEKAEATDVPKPTDVPEPTLVPKGGTLIWGTNSEPETMDHQCTYSSLADSVYKTVFDSLVYWSPDFEFCPYLAESWDINDDLTVFTFKLREDVTFHDGTPFNADAVKFNFDRLVGNEDCAGTVATGRLGKTLDTVEVIDEFTVKFTFTGPNPTFLTALSDLYYHSPASVEEFGEDLGRNPAGTGAFTFKEWVDLDHLTVVRNEDYNWGPTCAGHEGPAFLDEVTFRFIPDSQVRVAALEAGEIHIADNLTTKESYDVLEEDPDLIAYKVCRPGVNSGWHLNASAPPFDDIKVREAIGYLIDRETAIETLFGGFIDTYYGILSECTWSYWEGSEDYWRYNPEKGLALLAEAGWTDSDGDGMLDKDGEPFVFDTFGMSEDNQIVAFEFWQATLREFGIDYQPEYAEPGVVVEQCHGAQRDACVLGWRSTDPSVLGIVFHSDNIGSGFAWSHLADEEIDSLLAAGAIEPDTEKRKQIYQDLQKRILDLYIYFPFWRLPGVVGYDPALVGQVHLPYPQYIYVYDAYIQE